MYIIRFPIQTPATRYKNNSRLLESIRKTILGVHPTGEHHRGYRVTQSPRNHMVGWLSRTRSTHTHVGGTYMWQINGRPRRCAYDRCRWPSAARRARFGYVPGLEQVLQGRFADARHEVGPSVGVAAFRAVARAGGPVAPVRLAGRRQEIAEAQRKVLQAYLPVAVPVQVSEYHVRVAVADLELGAQLAELVRSDPALAVPVALVEQVLQMDVAHGRSACSPPKTPG